MLGPLFIEITVNAKRICLIPNSSLEQKLGHTLQCTFMWNPHDLNSGSHRKTERRKGLQGLMII